MHSQCCGAARQGQHDVLARLPMRRTTVLHVLGTADDSGTGISNMVRTLAAHLDPADFKLVACFLGGAGPWTERLQASGVTAYRLPWSSPLDLAGAWRLWSFLRGQGIDLVHLHYGGRSVRKLVKLATGAPLVVHVHGRVRSEHDYRPVVLPIPEADAVIATSRAAATIVQAKTVRVVYPGVPGVAAMSSPGARDDGLVVGAAGRLVPIKGYDRLLDAFGRLRHLQPRARLEIAGDGPSRAELERKSVQLGIQDAVHFLGWQEDLAKVMAGWAVFVQPSLEEAFGITVLQAMASGLPVIASEVGGLPEIVDPGVTGLLVPPGDVPALTHAMNELLGDPSRQRSLGAAALRVAAQFGEDRFAADVAAVYRELTR